jgi:hypothetical protein
MHATTSRLYFPNIVSTWSIRNYANTERRLALPRQVSHGNTIIVFLTFCTNLQKIDEIWTLLNTELSIPKIYEEGTVYYFGFYGLYFNVKLKTKLYVKRF